MLCVTWLFCFFQWTYGGQISKHYIHLHFRKTYLNSAFKWYVVVCCCLLLFVVAVCCLLLLCIVVCCYLLLCIVVRCWLLGFFVTNIDYSLIGTIVVVFATKSLHVSPPFHTCVFFVCYHQNSNFRLKFWPKNFFSSSSQNQTVIHR